MNNKSNFYVPWRKSFSVFFAILFSAPIIMLLSLPEIQDLPIEIKDTVKIPHTVYLLYLIALIIPQISIWYLSTMTISDEGIVLYRVNKLSWSDIVEARKSKSFGFNSIHIKRIKGLSWSLPLYMKGNETIKEALLKHVPESNILYTVANDL
jgi:hypothetical protein